ncbi:hypothetical protein ANN_13110 [Periplaneta americana]|uniref:Uncharacterized protein n=1 Tax=Periplaneta americana TaxID=6978 RepID=A0ABQ8TJ07_PERAM|nr:hypothetical protein ANN_13110 [Periplaneta americana]
MAGLYISKFKLRSSSTTGFGAYNSDTTGLELQLLKFVMRTDEGIMIKKTGKIFGMQATSNKEIFCKSPTVGKERVLRVLNDDELSCHPHSPNREVAEAEQEVEIRKSLGLEGSEQLNCKPSGKKSVKIQELLNRVSELESAVHSLQRPAVPPLELPPSSSTSEDTSARELLYNAQERSLSATLKSLIDDLISCAHTPMFKQLTSGSASRVRDIEIFQDNINADIINNSERCDLRTRESVPTEEGNPHLNNKTEPKFLMNSGRDKCKFAKYLNDNATHTQKCVKTCNPVNIEDGNNKIILLERDHSKFGCKTILIDRGRLNLLEEGQERMDVSGQVSSRPTLQDSYTLHHLADDSCSSYLSMMTTEVTATVTTSASRSRRRHRDGLRIPPESTSAVVTSVVSFPMLATHNMQRLVLEDRQGAPRLTLQAEAYGTKPLTYLGIIESERKLSSLISWLRSGDRGGHSFHQPLPIHRWGNFVSRNSRTMLRSEEEHHLVER